MSRLVVVSNRLPVSVVKRKDGLRFQASQGGLATGLGAYFRTHPGLWVGWPGVMSERVDAEERRAITQRLATDGCHPVFLRQRDVDDFYLGFANRALWPLAHYFTQYTTYDDRQWAAYRTANRAYRDAVLAVAEPDDMIWVHDYHLMLLPQLLRERRPEAAIGFFLHIPFPSFEVFRQIPWRRELLDGLMGADLIGFHTADYAAYFEESAARLAGARWRSGLGVWRGRAVRAGAFPMGIDYDAFASAVGTPEVEAETAKIQAQLTGRRVVLSLDRLDYSKGIPGRIEAFARFLERHPEFRQHVTLIVVAVPSRAEVAEYRALKRQVQERISEVNGHYGTWGWVPIWYLYQSVPLATLVALYHTADVAMVTPLRDGMNLIAKEYVAVQTEGRGVLVLSEMAGAAAELTGAIPVNPYNLDEMSEAIHAALTMGEAERIERNRTMQRRLRRATVDAWAARFIGELGRAAGGAVRVRAQGGNGGDG